MPDRVTEDTIPRRMSSFKRRDMSPTILACPTWPVPTNRPTEFVPMSTLSAVPRLPARHVGYGKQCQCFFVFIK